MARRRLPKRPNSKAIAAAAHRQADAGPDRVVCLLCGEEFKAIRWQHLRAAHGLDGPHPVEDYKARFGLRVAASEETCERGRRAQISYWKARGQHWTEARLRAAIQRRLRRGKSVVYSQVSLELKNASRRIYGGWRQALEAVGVDPAAGRTTEAWTPERIVERVRGMARGGTRVDATRVRSEWPALHRAAHRAFGSWSATLQAAGLDPKRHRISRKVWDLAACRAYMRRVGRRRLPLAARDVPSGLYDTVLKEVEGGWPAFMASLGLTAAGGPKRRDWTAPAVLAAIRKRRRASHALGTRRVRADGAGLYQQGWKFFGSWSEALRAAGVDPDRVRLTRRWTRETVLEALRARAKRRRSMHYRAVEREESRLYKATRRLLPGGWDAALARAGLPPSSETARPPRRGRKR